MKVFRQNLSAVRRFLRLASNYLISVKIGWKVLRVKFTRQKGADLS